MVGTTPINTPVVSLTFRNHLTLFCFTKLRALRHLNHTGLTVLFHFGPKAILRSRITLRFLIEVEIHDVARVNGAKFSA